MPYRIILSLFDHHQAIQHRTLKKSDSLIGETATGLPRLTDHRVREENISILQKSLFDNLEAEETAVSPTLNPAALSFEPRVFSFSPCSTPRKDRHLSSITPLFAPVRHLDYRFSKISIDWQDMSETRGGSIDAGFGIIHLLRDQDDSNMYDLPNEEQEESTLVHGNGCMLAILAIPPIMSIQDFLIFVEPCAHFIEQIRILRDEMPNRCMALLKLRTREEAQLFLETFNGKPFISMLDDEICQVLRISSVEVRSTITPPFTFPLSADIPDSVLSPALPGSGSIELPSCVVCLERMDPQITALITTPCQHSFHCACLSKWASGKCPICRYSQTRLRPNSSNSLPPLDDAPQRATACEECGTSSSLWMCLLCGHVGCGRYAGRHAADHYEQSFHLYAMELETQRVWDYAGDAYVHRLIQNRSDGKLVELPSVGSSEYGSDWRTDRGAGPNYEDNAAQEKMERMGEEFAHLLTSQLESQRAYYVSKLGELKQDLAITVSNLAQTEQQADQLKRHGQHVEARLEEALSESSKWKLDRDVLEARIGELEKTVVPHHEKDKLRMEKKAEKAVEQLRTLQHELEAEKAQSQGLTSNMIQLRSELAENKVEAARTRLDMKDMQEQLRDVMFALSAQQKIAEEGGEAQGGSLMAQPSTSSQPSPASKRKKKKPKKPNLPQFVTDEGDVYEESKEEAH